MKASILLLDTDFNARLIRKVPVKDGKVLLKKGREKKEFIVDKARPFYLRTFFGSRPLYICKWSSIIPLEFDVKEKYETFVNEQTNEKVKLGRKELVVIDPSDAKWQEKYKITPELLASTHDMRFLKGMGKYGKRFELEGSPLPIILALVFGMILSYILIALKLIPIS